MLTPHSLPTTARDDRTPLRPNGKAQRARRRKRHLDSLVLGVIEPIGNQDANHARRNSRLEAERLGREIGLGQTLGSAAVVGTVLLLGNGGPDFLGYRLGEAEIDVRESLNHGLVHQGVIAVVEFEP